MNRLPAGIALQIAVRFGAAAWLLLTAGCAPLGDNALLGRDTYAALQRKYIVDQSPMFPAGARSPDEWGLSLAWQGDHYLLTADQNMKPDSANPDWRIRATIEIPLLQPGQIIVLGACKLYDQNVSTVAVIAEYDSRKPWLDDIDGAWAFDIHQMAFGEIPPENRIGLECLNKHYGLDEDFRVPPGAP